MIFKNFMLVCCGVATLGVARAAETPIKDIQAQIDPASGKAKDPAIEYALRGIVAAKWVVPAGDKVLAFVLEPGQPVLAVLTDVAGSADLIPRNEVTLSGKLGDGPLGAALVLKAGSVSVLATNKPVGMSEPRPGAFFADASALAGRYVQLTNASFAPGKFGSDGTAKAKASDGSEVTIRVGHGAVGRDVPPEPVNIFGIPVRVGAEWHLVAARFLLVRGRAIQDTATKRTCFTCHNPDVKVVGPAYREVAAKYRNDPNAVAMLTSQMEKGGMGKWGPVPMPALGAMVPPDERQALAEWILSYRWDALLAE